MIGDNFMWFPEKSGGTKVEGETSDTFFAHKKAFELRSFQFTMDNQDAVDSGSKGSVAGRAKFQEFEIEKDVDSASVPLYKACSLGTLIPTVMLAVRKAGGSSLLYLQYIFRYVHVTGITWTGGSGEGRATEKMTLSFKAMGFQYIAQAADGGVGRKQAWSWNTATQNDKQGSPSLEIAGIESAPDFLPGQL
jgi:type VI secretion system secreted protein Hcp